MTLFARRAAASLLILAVVPAARVAGDVSWVHDPATAGDFLTPGNWSPAFPGSSDTANINNGGTAQLSGSFTGYYLLVGQTNSGTFQVSGGSATLDSLYTGQAGSVSLSSGLIKTSNVSSMSRGTFTQSGGEHNSRYIYLGTAPGTGTYNLSGTGVINNSLGETLGQLSDGVGYFYQTGGTNNTKDLTLGDNYHSHGEYDFSGGQLTVSGTLTVSLKSFTSEAGLALFKQSNGAASVGFLNIGENGTYEMTGGSLTINTTFASKGVLDFKGTSSTINVADGGRVDFSAGTLANAGNASFHVGANSITTVAAGFDPSTVFGDFSTQGIVHVAGTEIVIPAGMTFTTQGTIGDHVRVAGNLRSTANTTGLVLDNGLTVEGGSVDVTTPGFITVNVDDTSSGISSGSLAHGQMTIGKTGVGSFHQTGGTISANVTLGSAASASGSYVLDAGTLSGQIVVGDSGTGAFTQTGGSVSMFIMTVGQLNTGSYTLSGTGSIDGERLASTPQYQAEIRVGLQAQGTFTQESGTVSLAGRLTVGAGIQGNGTYLMKGGTLTLEDLVMSGNSALGTFNQSGGDTVVSGSMWIGQTGAPPTGGQNGNGVFILSGGTFSANNISTQGFGVLGSMAVSGGTLTAQTLQVGFSGGLTQTGGTVNVSRLTVNSGRTLTYSGGALHVSKQMDLLGTLDFANASPTLYIDDGASAFLSAGTISNSHNATLMGGVNSFINLPAGTNVATDFAAVISQGTVHVDGHPLTIESGKVVGGTGSIVGDVTNSGDLSPGHSPGSLAITGDLTESSDGTMTMDIAGRDAGQFDVITATGDVTLDGTLVVRLLDGFVPNAGDSFVMLTGGTLSGEFANAPGTVATNGGVFTVLYGPSSLTLTGFTPVSVPEPAAIGVLGLGAVGLLRRRRR